MFSSHYVNMTDRHRFW